MWEQVYDPFGNIYISALVAIIPVIFFFIALTVLKMKGYIASSITLILAIIVAVVAFGMPTSLALLAAIEGFLYGLWPIAWIIVSAVFLYKLSVKSGQFDIIRESIVFLTDDRRVQVLLISFCFGGFLEGAAGFGAPVAITAALLVGLGFAPLYAAGLCLIANTAPVAFGALGIPILVAAQATNLDADTLGMVTSRQLVIITCFIPCYLVWLMDGIKGIKETLPAILTAGITFSVTQYLTTHFVGYQLPGVTSSLVTLIALAVLLQFWKPKMTSALACEGGGPLEYKDNSNIKNDLPYSLKQIFLAWSPFLILIAMVVIWTNSGFKALFNADGLLSWLSYKFELAGLHNAIAQSAPIVTTPKPLPAIIKFDPISATGTAIFLTAIISIFIMKLRIAEAIEVFFATLKELKTSIISIGIVLGFAYVTNKSGVSVTAALVLAGTGSLFPFFSPLLGWLGVFITGSDASSNALFGSLQANTANTLGISENITVAANNSGGVTGKMISPQSIAIATAVVGMQGKESDLFKFTLRHSIFFAICVGIMVTLQAYVFGSGSILSAL